MDPRLVELASRILRLPPDAITPELGMENCAQWTSLVHVELIASVEEAFSISVGEDDFFDLLDLASIDVYLRRAAPDAAE